LLGINYFNCPDGHGLFLPPSRLKPDNRFDEVGASASEAPPTASTDQDNKSSQPGRSASAPEDAFRDLFSELGLGMQDDTGTCIHYTSYFLGTCSAKKSNDD
jgi:hypothetical protein